ncbi:Tumor necrosis factor alpha-induced protein 2 [Merluccius polli]|uniref:Tumor necrosis factor alpha-induced protein 2 n=1 Tax=Merluccius polli TaxID=89951 RepID=A0AA47NYW0_MERPO|nr:Tumor necrosis factor alpha-induced protein 2 [Merluccius polli]
MLDQKLFAEASRLLISREDRLFSRGSGPQCLEEEHALHNDLDALLDRVWAIQSTFTSPSSTSSSSSSSFQEDLHLLQSAASVIQQQEAQDRCWKKQWKNEKHGGGRGARLPVWRPLECLQTHRKLLATMVESRLNRAPVDHGEASKLSSAAKRELCGVGRRLKEDLLVVARKVSRCYPEELGIPKLYANLYHQAFARRMTELARSRLGIDECIYLLLWVNDYYPK